MKALKVILASMTTGFVYVLGGWDKALMLVLLSMGFDYFTGIIKAIKNKKLNSEIGREGIAKKFYMLVEIGVAVILDEVFGSTGLVRNFMCYYIISNECLSIVENGAEFGFPMPEFIKDKLEQLKDKYK